MSDKLDEAIQLAKEYLDAHYFKKRLSEGDKNARRHMSEKVRLGGMTLILQALEEAKAKAAA